MDIGYLVELDINIKDPPFDGPANHVRHVVAELMHRGHRVRVLFRLHGQTWITDNLEHFRLLDTSELDGGPLGMLERAIRRTQYELGLPYVGLFESMRFARACRRHLRDADVLYERNSWMTYGGALASRRMGIPLILEDNGDPLDDLEAKGQAPSGLQLRVSKAVMRRAIRSAAHIVSTGDGWRDRCIERWQIDPSRVTAIENGTVLVSLLAEEDLRVSRDVDSVGPVTTVAYVGGFLPWHGVGLLLDGFARASNQAGPMRLMMIGAGPGLAEAQERAEHLGISDVVDFKGQMPPKDYAPLLADADIGVSPYCDWPEYSGLKILDYKAAGLAVITSGKGGRPKTVQHGHTGFVVEPCDRDALADAIVRLVSDRDLRWQMGRRARQQAENSHRWSHTVAKLEEILAESVVNHGVHASDETADASYVALDRRAQ